jgi:hypothetical protein
MLAPSSLLIIMARGASLEPANKSHGCVAHAHLKPHVNILLCVSVVCDVLTLTKVLTTLIPKAQGVQKTWRPFLHMCRA